MNERSDEQNDQDKLDTGEAQLLSQFAADHAPDAIYWIDENARLIYVNQAACAALEYTRDELLRLSIPDIDPTWPIGRWQETWEALKKAGDSAFETVHKTKHGRIFPVEIHANIIEYGGRSLDCAYARDISERKRAENALRESSQMLKLVLDNIPVAVWWKDRDGVYLGGNYLDARHAGLASPDEIVGRTDFDMPWTDTEAEIYRADDREVMESGVPKLDYEETLHTADGKTIWIRTSKIPLRNSDGEIIGVMGTFDDITKRKEAERALRSTQFAVDSMQDVALWVSPGARFVYANKAATKLLGYEKDELLGMTVFDIDSSFSASSWASHWDEVREKRVMTKESLVRTKDGRLVPVEIRVNFVEFEGKQLHYAFVRDISERKRAEEALRTANRTLAALSRVNEILVRATQESELLQDVCTAIVEVGGYSLAWVGYAEYDADKTVRPVACAGNEDGYLEQIRVSWGDSELGRGPVGRAIKTGKSVIIDDVRTDPSFAPWRRKAADRGYLCSISLPLMSNGHCIGALALYRSESDCLDQAEESLLSQLASDLSYGISSLRAKEERIAAEAERRGLEQRLDEHKRRFYRETIQSVTGGKLDICDISEVKPYISGAEIRVDVKKASDVVHCRKEVRAFLSANGVGGETLCSFMLAVGEAITNALKHGGRGRVFAGRKGSEIWVAVRDRGPGIESLILPRAVLRRGFSTKPSLGLGYSIMLDIADRILLKTGASGTTVVLIRYLDDTGAPSLDSIPDTWETIPDVAS